MKKMILGFILMVLVVSAGLGAPAAEEKPIQFSLGGNLLMLTMEGGDSTFLVGAALRVDFNLGKSFILAPELSAGIGGWTAGGTFNFRSGKFFAGAGALAVGAFRRRRRRGMGDQCLPQGPRRDQEREKPPRRIGSRRGLHLGLRPDSRLRLLIRPGGAARSYLAFFLIKP